MSLNGGLWRGMLACSVRYILRSEMCLFLWEQHCKLCLASTWDNLKYKTWMHILWKIHYLAKIYDVKQHCKRFGCNFVSQKSHEFFWDIAHLYFEDWEENLKICNKEEWKVFTLRCFATLMIIVQWKIE